jgi:hypothetical protein
MPKPETKFISEPPVGFETLSEGAIRNILQYADLPPDDPAQLKNLTPTQIYELARDKDKFGAGGSIASVIPDGGDAIRTALILRAKLIIEASKHSGFNIPGAQDRENLLSEIRQALHGPDKEPDDGFPF